MADTITNMFLRHSVFLQRLTGGLGAEQIAIIDKNNPELRGELLQFLDDNEFYKLTKAQQDRIAVFRNKVYKLRGGAVLDASDKYSADMFELAEKEQLFIAKGIEDLGTKSLALSSPAALKKMTERTPFLGSTINQIYTKLSVDDTNRIMNTTVDGIKNGLTRKEIEDSVFGIKKLGYKGSAIQHTRDYINNPSANSGVIRTTINGIVNESRRELYQANSDIIKHEIYKATLDLRTSKTCAPRDGNIYMLGQGPSLPAHINCRSYYEPVIDGINIDSTRPYVEDTRTAKERELDFRRDSKENGTTVKQEKDIWKKKAIGQVPSSTRFDTWLGDLPAKSQKSYLGKTRYDLYKKGDLNLDKFTDAIGKPYTIEELYILDEKAFTKAGLTAPK
jgi:hypothetical protein